MRKYIFLDNWVLSKLTGAGVRHRLITFLKSNDYTGLITSLLMTELYNPGWETTAKEDRAVKAVDFLSEIRCVIVDPDKVFRAEIDRYPDPLKTMPVELDLQEIPDDQRAQILLQFMRRDISFLNQGKDIEGWCKNYKKLKGEWLNTTKSIIDHARNEGILKQNKKGKFIDLEKSKELFLLTLDLRHIHSVAEKDALLTKIIAQKSSGNWFDLLAIRVTSLCIWYSYIDIDPSNIPPYKPSDIGDYYHIGLIPYCSAFTIDNPMQKLLQRFREQHWLRDCVIFSEANLRTHLGIS